MEGGLHMEGPIISIDVSNGCSHFRCFIDRNKPFGKVHKIKHDVDGFQYLLDCMERLNEKTNEESCVVYEATGVYTKPLIRFLNKHEVKHYMVDPLQAAKMRKTDLHSKKTDKNDPNSIAKVYYDKDLYEYEDKEQIYHNLQVMNRNYEDQLDHLRKYKVTFQNLLSIVFPGYGSLFKNPYCNIALAILKKYPHPDIIKNKKPETVAKYLEKHTCHKKKSCLKWATKVIEYANKTYSGCEKDEIEVIELLRIIKELEACIISCESQLNEMIQLAEQLPNYFLILSIAGIGSNLACRILAEIGDIRRFSNKKKLISYAGIDPHINQSGDIDGLHLSISKKGNKRLRCLLYLAVSCNLRQKNEDDPIQQFYKKKKQQSALLKPKAARVACTNKLLRIIYGMCKNGCLYQNKP